MGPFVSGPRNGALPSKGSASWPSLSDPVDLDRWGAALPSAVFRLQVGDHLVTVAGQRRSRTGFPTDG